MSQQTQTAADAKRAYIQQLIAENPSLAGTVIVLPAFMEEDGQHYPTEDSAIASGGTKGFGYVALIQTRTVFGEGVQFENELWAIQRGKLTSLEAQYKAGASLPGNIVVKDTLTPPNPALVDQDLKFTSAATREANEPCMQGDKPIYQIKFWDPTGTKHDVTLEHTNAADLQVITDRAKAAANKPNAGMSGAASRARQTKPAAAGASRRA